MKYQFNPSKVLPISDELILIPCLQRTNEGDENFHHKCRMRCQSNWRRLANSYLWKQEFFNPKIWVRSTKKEKYPNLRKRNISYK